MKHKFLKITLIFAMLILFTPLIASAASSGTCGAGGDNLTWTLDDNGTFTISGRGDMVDYGSYSAVPWYNDRLAIRTVIIEEGVTHIGSFSFEYCGLLTSVTIPDGITSIGECAFKDCVRLISIAIPESVTSIGGNAFMACRDLESVYISDLVAYLNISFGRGESNPTQYASELYLNNEQVTEIDIPDGIKQIPVYAFDGCSSLTRVTIPDSVTSIGKRAFCGCGLRDELIIPDSVKSIGDDAFSGCRDLTSINIGSGVKSIGNHAFARCSQLTSITIPDNVISIGGYAFENCSGLTDAVIGNGVVTIGTYAFSRCKNMENISIGSGVMNIGNFAFAQCIKLTDVRIPDNVLSIGGGAFAWCDNLSSVEIGDNVISIGFEAFQFCPELTNITFPGNVSTIGRRAFKYCRKLNLVTIPKSVKKIEESAFLDCDAIKYVEYGGSESEWNEIYIGEENDNLKKSVYYNSANAPVPKETIHVNVDDREVSFDVAPQLVNERTLVPLRAIFEALGAIVDWDKETQTITSIKDNTVIKMTIDSDVMYVNDEEVILDVPATIVNERTLVPVRAISEAYNANVEWDGDSKTVKITSAK